jgi:death on curing protein
MSALAEPRWIDRSVAELFHDDQLRQHGGLPGLRDRGLLEAALARPRQRFAYEPGLDLADLAAAYAVGLARNHPFVDGNKRLAFLVCAVLLDLNGLSLDVPEAEVVVRMRQLASGELDEASLAEWLRRGSRARSG